MQFVFCTYEDHASAILEILNEAIVHSTALYDYQPRPFESMTPWFEAKRKGDFPVIGAIDANGELMGFATYGTFRPFPAYKYTVEHSVYVHTNHRGKGLGMALMMQLIALAKQQDVHVLIGGIDLSNQASIHLHERLGFRLAGTISQAAFKFNRWLDLGFYQLTLETPAKPVDG
ncbi:N-acetyltransferase [Bremerella cremea]|uniref:N-acetyltransferase n=1 Tax=Bremerella cremea TaxID=1031537 RepID=A0A368KML5_9BACT|nr:GNAT family N-acetyltransferase [Bremerella cremea]RCS43256.1 N-acetyltransferase [Bremerella cremea]